MPETTKANLIKTLGLLTKHIRGMKNIQKIDIRSEARRSEKEIAPTIDGWRQYEQGNEIDIVLKIRINLKPKKIANIRKTQ